MNARLRERLDARTYGDTTDERAFAEAVSEDTTAVSGDSAACELVC